MTDVVLALPLLSDAALANAASLRTAIQNAPANAATATALEVLAASDGLKNLQTGWLSSGGRRSILTAPVGAYLHRTRHAHAGGGDSVHSEIVWLAPSDSNVAPGRTLEGWNRAKALKAIDDFEKLLQDRLKCWNDRTKLGIPLSNYLLAVQSLETSLLPLVGAIREKIETDQILEARILFEEVALKWGVDHSISEYPPIRLALRVEWGRLPFEKLLELAGHLLPILEKEIQNSFERRRLDRDAPEDERVRSMQYESDLTRFVRKAGEVMGALPLLVAQEKFQEAQTLLQREIVGPIKKPLSNELATDGIEEIFIGMLEVLSQKIPAKNNMALLAQECLEMARRDLSDPKALKDCEALNDVARWADLDDSQKAQTIVRRIKRHAEKEGADNLNSKLDELLARLR